MIWAGVKQIQKPGSPIETEAESMKWAMQILGGFGHKQVIFETDCQVLARMAVDKECIWPKLKPFLQEIQNHLSTNPDFRVVYTTLEREIRQQIE